MFIVDSHLHFFSHDFFAALVRQKDAHASIERVLAELAARTKIELPDRDLKTHVQHWLRNWFAAAMPRGCWNGESEGSQKTMSDELEVRPGRTPGEEIAEARAAQAAGHIGRARTCARRAVGMMLRAKIGIGPGAHDYAPTFILGLRKLAGDSSIPAEVRAAAMRLADRSKPDRSSASENPTGDADLIFRYFGVE